MAKINWQKIKFSDKFYRYFIRPFDKILYPVISAENLAEKRLEETVPFNKIPQVADIHNQEWKAVAESMKDIFKIDENLFHRKIWESIHIIYSLKSNGFLFPQNQGLAIGAGREEILYYLAHKIKKITAIDLYEGTYVGGEDEPDIPEQPQKYAPFFYPPENLEISRMDARSLSYQDDQFDFIISLSSIEHFGSLADIERSVVEMVRVLKPGGACVITTELALNRLASDIPNTRIFELTELIELFKRNGLILDSGPIDVSIEDKYLKEWVKLPDNIYKSPHVIVRFFKTIFTSLCLFLTKPGDKVKRGEWLENLDIISYEYKGVIRVEGKNAVLKRGDKLDLDIEVKNSGNFFWYTDGYSHRIAIAVKLLKYDGAVSDHFFSEIVIPEHVDVNKSQRFNGELILNLAPGKYKLFFDLKKERVLGFSDQGNEPCIIDIEIT